MKKRIILVLLALTIMLCGCSSKSNLQKQLDTPGSFVNEKTELFQVPGIEWGMTLQETINKMGIKGFEKNYIQMLMEDSKEVPANIGGGDEEDCFLIDGEKVSVIFEIYNARCYQIDFCRNGYDYPDAEKELSILQKWHEKLINEYGTENYYTNIDKYSSVDDLQEGDNAYAVWAKSSNGKSSILCLYAYIVFDADSGSKYLYNHIFLAADIDEILAIDKMKSENSFLQDLDLSGKSN